MSQGEIAKTQIQIFQGRGYIGKRFGMLVVLDDTMAVGKPKKKAEVLCRCDCGNTVTRTIDNIERGRTQSCGCLSKLASRKIGERSAKDLTGKRFGKLTAIRIAGKNKRGYENLWECNCDCGKTKYAVTSNLMLGRTTHCGRGCEFVYPKKKKTKKKRPIDREQFAKDAYCLYLEAGSIRNIVGECGYRRGHQLSTLFSIYVPGYKKRSEIRRAKSRENKKEIKHRVRSTEFRFEKDFQDYVVKTVLAGVKLNTRVIGLSAMEIDVLVEGGIMVELKIVSRKTDIAKALGQCIINRNTFQSVAAGQIICVPNDVDVDPDIISACVESKVVCCSAAGLVAVVDRLKAVCS